MKANVISINSSLKGVAYSEYYELQQTYLASNKSYILGKVELDLLGILVYRPEYYDIIFSHIAIEQISEGNRKAFQIMKDNRNEINKARFLLMKVGFREDDYSVELKEVNESTVNKCILDFSQFYTSNEVEQELIRNLKEAESSIDGKTLAYNIRNAMDALIEKLPDFEKEKSLAEEIPDYLNSLEQLAASKGMLFLSDKFPRLNEATGGLAETNTLIVMGSTGQGKTFFSTELITDIQKKYNIPVGIVSLEMSKTEIQNRIIGAELGINSLNLRDPEKLRSMPKEEVKKLACAYEKFKNSKIYIHDKQPTNENQLRELVKRWKNERGVRMIMLDYIGILGCSKFFSKDYEKVGYLSGFIKGLATEFKVSFIILAQGNRANTNEPDIANIAGSFKILQDTDTAVTISQPYKTNPQGFYELKRQKNIPVTPDIFYIETGKSRHTGNYPKFFVKLSDKGMRELS